MNNTFISAIDYNVCLNRNGYTNSKGFRQVVVELYQQGSRRTINTHIHVKAEDFRYGRIQATNPNYDLLNRRIHHIIRRLMELEDEMLDAGQVPTPQRLAEAFKFNLTPSATIQEWVSSIIMPSARKKVTKDNYRTLCRSLEIFCPGLHIGEVNHDFIMRWQNWMRNERHLCDNTISVRLKTLRCLINEAIKRNVIHYEHNPFRHIHIPEIKARREHLSENELRAIEQTEPDDNHLRHVRDAFLFCCYTGLRWGDFRSLTSNNLTGQMLTFCQHKTGNHVSIPLGSLWNGKALLIINRYGALESLADIGDNQSCNRALRKVGELAKLKCHLHWHLARHTCGTLLNQRGLRMQEIQYILGHQKIQTTERHYAETTYKQVRESLEMAFGK